MLSVCLSTHPGTVRTANEDSAIWDRALSFVAVADGMGGHNAGGVASKLALEAVAAFLDTSAGSDDFTWPFGIDPTASLNANRLSTAVKLANQRVFRASEERDEYTGMGTTLVVALARDNHLTFANVGDSRLYTMQHGVLRQISRDDSWVAMLAQESGREPSSFHESPLRNVLTNAVGGRPTVGVALGEFELADGQLILLCTDGLHGGVPDDQMADILRAETDLQRAADALVQTAVTQDGHDNVTVVLGRYSPPPSG